MSHEAPPSPRHADAPSPATAQAVVEQDLAAIVAALPQEFAAMAGGSLLILGGAGFLGYYLVQAAVRFNRGGDAGIAVSVWDNFARGVPAWLEAIADADEVRLRRHDVTDPWPADAVPFDYIVHAASIASPTYYRRRPIETMDANVNGLRRVLDHARDRVGSGRPVRGVLYFSTSEIYGDPPADAIPTPETFRGYVSCTGPRACYDESKRYGETLCVNFARRFGLPVAVARPFNNYGPGLKVTDRRVLPDFVRDALAGRDVVLRSDGSPTRTFCYVADAVAGYYKVLTRGRPGEAYNIGADAPEVSMRELADRVVAHAARLWGYAGRAVFRASEDRDYLTDNPRRRCPDLTKARAELGYDPQVGIDEGLERAMVWCREHRTAEEA